MAGRHGVGAEVTGRVQEIGEFDVLIAAHARDGRFARDITLGKRGDDLVAEAAFIIEHVVRDPEFRRHRTGIVDIASGAAGSFARGGFGSTGVVELQGDADDVVAVAGQQCGHHRGVDATRHRDDDPGRSGGLRKSERVQGKSVFHRQQRRETGGHHSCSNVFADALPALGRATGRRSPDRACRRVAEEERPASSAQACGLGSFFGPGRDRNTL